MLFGLVLSNVYSNIARCAASTGSPTTLVLNDPKPPGVAGRRSTGMNISSSMPNVFSALALHKPLAPSGIPPPSIIVITPAVVVNAERGKTTDPPGPGGEVFCQAYDTVISQVSSIYSLV